MLRKPSKGQVKLWSKLAAAKYRRQEAAFLAEGVKVVHELLRSPRRAAALMVLSGRERRWESLLEGLSYPVDTYLLTEGEWGRISQDKEPEGIMALVQMPPPLSLVDIPEGHKRHLLLGYNINNPSNFGALLRTAHWFGIRTVISSRGSVDSAHPKVVRSAMGSLFHLNILEEADFTTLLAELRRSYTLIATDAAAGVTPRAMPGKTALILGNETHGLPADLKAQAHACWHIPRRGDADSLSLPQAAAILMYELTNIPPIAKEGGGIDTPEEGREE
jgi:RNA methyltransferase, TrmH family